MKNLISSVKPVHCFFCVILLFTFSTVLHAQQLAPVAPVKKIPVEQILPPDFITDGCTVWFNTGAFKNCCVQHDLDYYNRQGWQARLQADNRLFMCVANSGFGYKLTAPIMWVGVRIFGSPWFPIHRKRRYAVKKTNN